MIEFVGSGKKGVLYDAARDLKGIRPLEVVDLKVTNVGMESRTDT